MQGSAPSFGFVLKITVFGIGSHAHSVSLPFRRRWRHPSGGVVHHGALRQVNRKNSYVNISPEAAAAC
jgi:hypothetical protein